MAKAKAKKKAVKKKAAKVKAPKARPPKPAPKPYPHKKLDRLTIKMLTSLDPCWEGLEWFKKALAGSKGSYDFTDAAVDRIFDQYIPAVTFDFRWLSWIFERLTIDKLIDGMNPNYERFNQEKKRIERVNRVFHNECSRAARDYSLGITDMQKRVGAANLMMKMFNHAYKEI